MKGRSALHAAAPTGRGFNRRADTVLLRVVDGGLASTLLVLPFFFGGRGPLGQLVLVLVAVTTASAWTLRQLLRRKRSWRSSAAVWLLTAGVFLLLLQMSALPPWLLDRMAGQASQILPLWSPQASPVTGLGPWSTISLTPAATRAALVVFLAYCALFVVTVQRIRVLDDVERLLRWCALSAVVMATFGLIQFLASNEKFFWFYEHPFSTTSDFPKGSFTNRNHFAHFLALGIGPLIWYVQYSMRRGRRGGRSGDFGRLRSDAASLGPGTTWGLVGLGVVLFAILLSLSRGGTLVSAGAVILSIGVAYRARAVGFRFAAGTAITALVVLAGLATFGSERVSERLDDLASGSLAELDKADARRTIWGTAAKATADYPVLGSGVGSFQEVYPMYLEWRQNHLYYTHSENGYLQVALETGLVGLVLVLAGIGCAGAWCLRGFRKASSKRTVLCVGAVTASLAVSVAHSVVDFVWYVPACLATVAVLAGCASRLADLAGQPKDGPTRSASPPKTVWAVAAIAVAIAGVWMVANRTGPALAAKHWQRVRRLVEATEQSQLPPDGSVDAAEEYLLAAQTPEDRAGIAAELVAELEQIVRCDPNHATAHLQLAEAYIQLFDCLQLDSVNQIPLSQIKDAALQSQAAFQSRDAYRQWLTQWLDQAVGEHHRYLDLAARHARTGLRLCPLGGEGYLYLAELCFLEGGTTQIKSAYMDQAVTVRPFHGTVLFHAGNEALLEGRVDAWLQYWKRSFNSGRLYERDLIDHLVGRTGPDRIDEETRFILETFQPDVRALRYMYYRYRRFAQPEQLGRLRTTYARATEAEAAGRDGEDAARSWIEAMSLYLGPEQLQQKLQCAERAMVATPNSYDVRYCVALTLAEAGRYAEAQEHLEWCLTRRPGNRTLEKKFRQMHHKQTEQEWQMTASQPTESRYR